MHPLLGLFIVITENDFDYGLIFSRLSDNISCIHTISFLLLDEHNIFIINASYSTLHTPLFQLDSSRTQKIFLLEPQNIHELLITLQYLVNVEPLILVVLASFTRNT